MSSQVYTTYMIALAIHMPIGQSVRKCGYQLARQRVGCEFLLTLRNFAMLSFISKPASFLSRMALNALERRNITQIHRMLEWLVGFVAILAFVIGERTQIHGMDERAHLYRRGRIHRSPLQPRSGFLRVHRTVRGVARHPRIGETRLAGLKNESLNGLLRTRPEVSAQLLQALARRLRRRN